MPNETDVISSNLSSPFTCVDMLKKNKEGEEEEVIRHITFKFIMEKSLALF
jgi:hypothetical protein